MTSRPSGPSRRSVNVRALASMAVTPPRVPLATPSWAMAVLAHELDRVAFPGVQLPAVLGQLAGAEAEAEGAEAAAGVDRCQLPVIADQHHLGLGVVGVFEEAGELAGADHAGLVDHQHRSG